MFSPIPILFFFLISQTITLATSVYSAECKSEIVCDSSLGLKCTNMYNNETSVSAGTCLCESPSAWNIESGKCNSCESGYIKDETNTCGN